MPLYELVIVFIIFGSVPAGNTTGAVIAASITPVVVVKTIGIPMPLKDCLAGVDEANSALAATRPPETPGRAVLEWKARCYRAIPGPVVTTTP